MELPGKFRMNGMELPGKFNIAIRQAGGMVALYQWRFRYASIPGNNRRNYCQLAWLCYPFRRLRFTITRAGAA